MTNYSNISFDVKNLKKQNLIIGFTNGCFDLLHKGHIHLLFQAKKNCDYLIVGLNSDLSVRALKGENRPIDSEKVRLENLLELNSVDKVLIFNDETPIKLIDAIIPNILIKGSDYKRDEIVGSNTVKNNGGSIILIDLLPKISTTNIIKKRKK